MIPQQVGATGPLRLTPRGLLAFDRVLPCTIGRSGLTDTKVEGDLATPRGRLRIIQTLYRPDRMAPPNVWATPIRPFDRWSDDPAQPHYNTLTRGPGSAEPLGRADPLYDLILVTDWNMPATPGKGSAIFVHRWRRPGHSTAGCIALHPADLGWLAGRIAPGAVIVV